MSKKLILLGASLAIVILASLFHSGKIWFTNPDRGKYPLRGVDVSHHQGDINWELVSMDDVSFAYIKATEADDFKDHLFQYNWENAIKNNIYVGAYHFYSLAYSGEAQAANFIAAVPQGKNQLPPVIDLEYAGNSKARPSKEDFQKDLATYIQAIQLRYEKLPILYTTYEFYKDYLYPEFESYEIWIRDIFSEPNANRVKNLAIWQYNPRGKVNGISGHVDLNATTAEWWNRR